MLCCPSEQEDAYCLMQFLLFKTHEMQNVSVKFDFHGNPLGEFRGTAGPF